MVKNKVFSTIIFLLILTAIIGIGCSRDIEDLEPATFPTTAEIFIDAFSGGLNYAAFSGSKVTAFDVDSDVKYKGTTSMRFEVPDLNDPEGGYAGGVFFTSTGRNLTGYNALTFWAKASQPATIGVIGFGNDLGELKYEASINDLEVNTNWKKYIIPIPDPSKLVEERGMLYYSEGPENDLGYTFWLDEVKFEKIGTIAHPKPAILETQDQVILSETGQQLPIGGTFQTINLPTGIDQRVEVAPAYFDYTSSNLSVATVNEWGVISVIDAGTAVITATLDGVEAEGSLTVQSSGDPILPLTAAPMPTVNQDSVISLFSNVYNNVTVDTWNTRWEFSTAEDSDLQINGDDVKRYQQLNFVGIEFSSQTIDASEMTHFHIDLWTPNATDLPASFKVLLIDFGADGTFDGGDDSSHELSFTKPTLETESWISLDIPISNFTGLTSRANLAQLVLSGDLPTVFIDNVYFYNAGSGPIATEPLVDAPNPTLNPSDVISIYSDFYPNFSGTDFNPDWGQATTVSEVQINGNNNLLYSGLDYQGTQFANNLDVTSKTHLHLDYWTANSTELNVYLISPGPIETSYALSVPTSGWGSVDIPLSDFSPVDLQNLIQLKFDGNGDIYLDNIYFFSGGGGGTSPTTAAPTPTYAPANVISIFSDAYTNVVGTNLNPDWGQATATSEMLVAGNNTLFMSGLNYQGIELGSNQDVSGMTHLQVDVWTANSSGFNVFIISPGPVETPYAISAPTAGWQTFDIPLSNFSPVDLTDVFQFKFEGDGDIYLDNIIFHN